MLFYVTLIDSTFLVYSARSPIQNKCRGARMMDHQKQCVHQHDENCLIGVNDPPEKEKKKHLRYRYNKLCVQRKDNWS